MQRVREISDHSRAGAVPDCECMDRNVTSFEQAHAVEGAVAEAAKVLAWKHYELEEGLTHIFRITDKTVATVTRGAPIKLLEVNTNTSESGIIPLQFGPSCERRPLRVSHRRSVAKQNSETPVERAKVAGRLVDRRKFPGQWMSEDDVRRPMNGRSRMLDRPPPILIHST